MSHNINSANLHAYRSSGQQLVAEVVGSGEHVSEEPEIESTDYPDSGTDHEHPPPAQAAGGEAFLPVACVRLCLYSCMLPPHESAITNVVKSFTILKDEGEAHAGTGDHSAEQPSQDRDPLDGTMARSDQKDPVPTTGGEAFMSVS